LLFDKPRHYATRDQGITNEVSRGVYRLSDLPVLSHPDFVIVSLRISKGVICLLSALAYHGLTTHIPHAVDLAIPRNSRVPHLDFPPIHVYRFSEASYSAGIEIHVIDNVPVQIYDLEKTLVDCFKFRNQVGLDIFMEALKRYKKNFTLKPDKIMSYARGCRVESAITPYIESLQCL